MAYEYSDENRASEPMALPDVEVFEHEKGLCDIACCLCCKNEQGHIVNLLGGFYYAYGFPGCLWDSDPVGPFDSYKEALEAAREE